MPTDKFAGVATSPRGPYTRSEEVVYDGDGLYVPSFVPTAILVGVAGTVFGRLAGDADDVQYPLAAGIWPLRFVRITDSTDATALRVLD